MASKDKLSKNDSIVVVMGPTGAGKSTFIDIATGQNGGIVGHELKSCTAAVQAVNTTHDNHPVVFVDTPGFDDTYKSDTEILSMIAEWLVQTYKGKFHITTILYLHRITDNRMAGSAAKNLRLFIDMCGKKAMPNIVIVTTMWGEVKETTGDRREGELKRDFWNDLLAEGCKVQRFRDTFASAWGIIGSLDGKDSADLLLPQQIVDAKLRLNETDAGVSLNKELEKLVKDRKEASRRLREQARNHNDKGATERLKRQQEEIEEKIRSTVAQLRELKIPIARKLWRFFKF